MGKAWNATTSFIGNLGEKAWDTFGKPLFTATTGISLPSTEPSEAQESAEETPTRAPTTTRGLPHRGGPSVYQSVVGKVVPALAETIFDRMRAQHATDMAIREAEAATRLQEQAATRAAESRQKEALQKKIEREMEREELAALYQPTQSAGQSQLQASEFADTMARRYPNVFQKFPQYLGLIGNQALGALMAPADPSDPLYAQKALGELEYEISQAEARVTAGAQPTIPQHAFKGLPPVAKLPHLGKPKGFRGTTKKSPSEAAETLDKIKQGLLGSKKGKGQRRGMRGGGVAAVFDA